MRVPHPSAFFVEGWAASLLPQYVYGFSVARRFSAAITP